MAKFEHDWFAMQMLNDNLTPSDLLAKNINTENTGMQSKDYYKSLDSVQNFFKTDDGKFDEERFNKMYDSSLYMYNQFSESDYEKVLLENIEKHPYLWTDPSNKVIDTSVTISTATDPFHRASGIAGIFNTSPAKFSVREIAQTQEAQDGDGNGLGWSPNDHAGLFKSIFQPTLAIASWDEDGTHIDSDGNEVQHYKGQYKVNDSGQFYYEKLNGRPARNKELLHYSDTLTVEGKWLNNIDFFDSDSLDKSVGASLTKLLVNFGILLTPAGKTLGVLGAVLNSAQALPIVAKSLDSVFGGKESNDFQKAMNRWSGYLKRFDANQTDAANESFMNFEKVVNQIIDTGNQLYQQKFVGRLGAMLAGNMGLKTSKTGTIFSRAYMAATSGMEAYDSFKYAGAKDWVAGAGTLATMAGFYRLLSSDYYKEYLFKNDSFLNEEFVVSRTLQNVGNDFKRAISLLPENPTQAEAKSFAGSVYNYIVNKGKTALNFVKKGAVTEADVAAKKATAGVADDIAEGLAKETPKSIKQQIINAMKTNGVAQKTSGISWYTMFLTRAANEAIEEMMEEAMQDTAKAFTLGMEKLGINVSETGQPLEYGFSFKDFLTRYLTAGIGGFVGGGIFEGLEQWDALWSPNIRNINSRDISDTKRIAYLIKEHKTADLHKEIDNMMKKGLLGSKTLSFDYDEYETIDGSMRPVFKATDSDAKSQNTIIAQALHAYVDYIEQTMLQYHLNLDDPTLSEIITGEIARNTANLQSALEADTVYGKIKMRNLQKAFEERNANSNEKISLEEFYEESAYEDRLINAMDRAGFFSDFYNDFVKNSANLIATKFAYDSARTDFKRHYKDTDDSTFERDWQASDVRNRLANKIDAYKQYIDDVKAGKHNAEYIERAMYTLFTELNKAVLGEKSLLNPTADDTTLAKPLYLSSPENYALTMYNIDLQNDDLTDVERQELIDEFNEFQTLDDIQKAKSSFNAFKNILDSANPKLRELVPILKDVVENKYFVKNTNNVNAAAYAKEIQNDITTLEEQLKKRNSPIINEIADIRKEWLSQISSIDGIDARNAEKLVDAIADDVVKLGLQKNIKFATLNTIGAFDPKTNTIIIDPKRASSIESEPNYIKRTFYHEVVGHYGLKEVFNALSKFKTNRSQIADTLSKLSDPENLLNFDDIEKNQIGRIVTNFNNGKFTYYDFLDALYLIADDEVRSKIDGNAEINYSFTIYESRGTHDVKLRDSYHLNDDNFQRVFDIYKEGNEITKETDNDYLAYQLLKQVVGNNKGTLSADEIKNEWKQARRRYLTDEYIALLAEETIDKTPSELSWWQKIYDFFKRLFTGKSTFDRKTDAFTENDFKELVLLNKQLLENKAKNNSRQDVLDLFTVNIGTNGIDSLLYRLNPEGQNKYRNNVYKMLRTMLDKPLYGHADGLSKELENKTRCLSINLTSGTHSDVLSTVDFVEAETLADVIRRLTGVPFDKKTINNFTNTTVSEIKSPFLLMSANGKSLNDGYENIKYLVINDAGFSIEEMVNVKAMMTDVLVANNIFNIKVFSMSELLKTTDAEGNVYDPLAKYADETYTTYSEYRYPSIIQDATETDFTIFNDLAYDQNGVLGKESTITVNGDEIKYVELVGYNPNTAILPEKCIVLANTLEDINFFKEKGFVIVYQPTDDAAGVLLASESFAKDIMSESKSNAETTLPEVDDIDVVDSQNQLQFLQEERDRMLNLEEHLDLGFSKEGAEFYNNFIKLVQSINTYRTVSINNKDADFDLGTKSIETIKEAFAMLHEYADYCATENVDVMNGKFVADGINTIVRYVIETAKSLYHNQYSMWKYFGEEMFETPFPEIFELETHPLTFIRENLGSVYNQLLDGISKNDEVKQNEAIDRLTSSAAVGQNEKAFTPFENYLKETAKLIAEERESLKEIIIAPESDVFEKLFSIMKINAFDRTKSLWDTIQWAIKTKDESGALLTLTDFATSATDLEILTENIRSALSILNIAIAASKNTNGASIAQMFNLIDEKANYYSFDEDVVPERISSMEGLIGAKLDFVLNLAQSNSGRAIKYQQELGNRVLHKLVFGLTNEVRPINIGGGVHVNIKDLWEEIQDRPEITGDSLLSDSELNSLIAALQQLEHKIKEAAENNDAWNGYTVEEKATAILEAIDVKSLYPGQLLLPNSDSEHIELENSMLLAYIAECLITDSNKFYADLNKGIAKLNAEAGSGELRPFIAQQFSIRLANAFINDKEGLLTAIHNKIDPKRKIKLNNVMSILGSSGTGKTSVILNLTAAINSDKQLYFGYNGESRKELIKQNVPNSGDKLFDTSALLNALDADRQKHIKEEDEAVLYVGNFNESTTSFSYLRDCVICIDEGTLLTVVDWQLLDQWAEKNNVKIITLGDPKQMAKELKTSSSDIEGWFTDMSMWTAPILTESVRNGNEGKRLNSLSFGNVIDNIMYAAMHNKGLDNSLFTQHPINLIYKKDKDVFYGDYIESDKTRFESYMHSVKAGKSRFRKDASGNFKDLSYVVVVDSEANKSKWSHVVGLENVKTIDQIQGWEWDYVFVDVNFDLLKRVSKSNTIALTTAGFDTVRNMKRLYTLLTRSREGTVILDESNELLNNLKLETGDGTNQAPFVKITFEESGDADIKVTDNNKRWDAYATWYDNTFGINVQKQAEQTAPENTSETDLDDDAEAVQNTAEGTEATVKNFKIIAKNTNFLTSVEVTDPKLIDKISTDVVHHLITDWLPSKTNGTNNIQFIKTSDDSSKKIVAKIKLTPDGKSLTFYGRSGNGIDITEFHVFFGNDFTNTTTNEVIKAVEEEILRYYNQNNPDINRLVVEPINTLNGYTSFKECEPDLTAAIEEVALCYGLDEKSFIENASGNHDEIRLEKQEEFFEKYRRAKEVENHLDDTMYVRYMANHIDEIIPTLKSNLRSGLSNASVINAIKIVADLLKANAVKNKDSALPKWNEIDPQLLDSIKSRLNNVFNKDTTDTIIDAIFAENKTYYVYRKPNTNTTILNFVVLINNVELRIPIALVGNSTYQDGYYTHNPDTEFNLISRRFNVSSFGTQRCTVDSLIDEYNINASDPAIIVASEQNPLYQSLLARRATLKTMNLTEDSPYYEEYLRLDRFINFMKMNNGKSMRVLTDHSYLDLSDPNMIFRTIAEISDDGEVEDLYAYDSMYGDLMGVQKVITLPELFNLCVLARYAMYGNSNLLEYVQKAFPDVDSQLKAIAKLNSIYGVNTGLSVIDTSKPKKVQKQTQAQNRKAFNTGGRLINAESNERVQTLMLNAIMKSSNADNDLINSVLLNFFTNVQSKGGMPGIRFKYRKHPGFVGKSEKEYWLCKTDKNRVQLLVKIDDKWTAVETYRGFAVTPAILNQALDSIKEGLNSEFKEKFESGEDMLDSCKLSMSIYSKHMFNKSMTKTKQAIESIMKIDDFFVYLWTVKGVNFAKLFDDCVSIFTKNMNSESAKKNLSVFNSGIFLEDRAAGNTYLGSDVAENSFWKPIRTSGNSWIKHTTDIMRVYHPIRSMSLMAIDGIKTDYDLENNLADFTEDAKVNLRTQRLTKLVGVESKEMYIEQVNKRLHQKSSDDHSVLKNELFINTTGQIDWRISLNKEEISSSTGIDVSDILDEYFRNNAGRILVKTNNGYIVIEDKKFVLFTADNIRDVVNNTLNSINHPVIKSRPDLKWSDEDIINLIQNNFVNLIFTDITPDAISNNRVMGVIWMTIRKAFNAELKTKNCN